MSETGQDDAADERTAAFVEQAGLLFEANGGPRAVGRMLGWLLVCDPPEQSAERVGVAGDRRTYYRVRRDAWSTALDAWQAAMTAFRRLADDGLGALDGAEPARRARLEEMRTLFGDVEQRFPALVRAVREG